MKVRWWHFLVGAGVLAALAYGGKKVVEEILIKRRFAALTPSLYNKIKKYADKHGVPLALALATVDLESGFFDRNYNPECAGNDGNPEKGATAKYGKRGSTIPYVTCSNNQYWRWNKFKDKWKKAGAVDADKPNRWGSYGLMQVLPDTAWGWGYSKDKPNAGLFDVETNLDVGMAKLAGAWKKYGNAADVRCTYKYGKDMATSISKYGESSVKKIVDKFFSSYLSLHEKKFGLPKVKRYA